MVRVAVTGCTPREVAAVVACTVWVGALVARTGIAVANTQCVGQGVAVPVVMAAIVICTMA